MTYRNKVIALSSTLAVLVLVYVAGLVFSPESREARAGQGRLFSGKASDAVSIRLEVAPQASYGGTGSAASVLSLVREDSAWFLEDGQARLPVQSGRVEAFLESLAAVSRLSGRSDGTGDLSGFGLAEGQASRVVVRDSKGTALADFGYGGRGPTGREVYVRPAGGKAVYAVADAFESYASGSRASWLDLRVYPMGLESAEVTGIAVTSAFPLDAAGKAQKPFAWKAARTDGGWKPTGQAGTMASPGYDAVALDGLVRSLEALTAEDLVAAPPAAAFAKVTGRLELSMAEGGPRVLEVGSSAGERRWYVRESGAGLVYVVSDYSLAGLFRPESALAAKK